MIDRVFSALLTFCVLAGGTAAIGSTLFANASAAPTAASSSAAASAQLRCIVADKA